MKGTHAVLQRHCPICISAFLVGDELSMRVVEIGVDRVKSTSIGVMIEYLHAKCEKPWGER